MAHDDQALCDAIRAKFPERANLVRLLEAAGFQCYDSESDQQLIEALAEHLTTEGLEISDLD